MRMKDACLKGQAVTKTMEEQSWQEDVQDLSSEDELPPARG